MTTRKALRAALRADLVSLFPTHNFRPAMAFASGDEGVPEMTVRIAREDVEEIDVVTVSRTRSVHVLWRDLGGDELEDTLDDTADALEAAVMERLAALEGIQRWGLATTDFNIDAKAARRLGTLTMTFYAVFYTEQGSQT